MFFKFCQSEKTLHSHRYSENYNNFRSITPEITQFFGIYLQINNTRLIIISLDSKRRLLGNVEIIHATEFLQDLWKGKIYTSEY